MRILYFSHGYSTHDRRFLAKMAEPGHQVLFLRLRDDGGAFEGRPLPSGVHALRWNGCRGALTPESCLALMPDFQRLLEEVRPDLLHAGPIPTCAFMGALSGFHPLVSMSWGSDLLVEAHESPMVGWAARFALAHSDWYVVDCDAVRQTVTSMVPAAADRFVQFPWGLELSRFPPPGPRRGGGPEIVVLSTRSWSALYGIDTVIEAFALAHAQEPRLRLVLVGDGTMAPRVEEMIAARGLGDVVRRPGRLPEEELGHLFAHADIYLSCSLSDGTSVSLLEALAYGLPVVVTDAPGNREWVEGQGGGGAEGGWLAPPGDAGAFAQALVQAAHLDASQRQSVALRHRALVESRADWHANTRRLLAVYQQAGTPA